MPLNNAEAAANKTFTELVIQNLKLKLMNDLVDAGEKKQRCDVFDPTITDFGLASISGDKEKDDAWFKVGYTCSPKGPIRNALMFMEKSGDSYEFATVYPRITDAKFKGNTAYVTVKKGENRLIEAARKTLVGEVPPSNDNLGSEYSTLLFFILKK